MRENGRVVGIGANFHQLIYLTMCRTVSTGDRSLESAWLLPSGAAARMVQVAWFTNF